MKIRQKHLNHLSNIVASNLNRNKTVRMGIFIGAIMLSWFAGLFNGPIALYEDFFAPRNRFEIPLKLEIPVGIKPINKTEIFQLKLQRKHGVYVHFVDKNGTPKNIAPALISGRITLRSNNGNKVLELQLSPDKQYGYSIRPIQTFHNRLLGVRKDVTIEVKELTIVQSLASIEQESLIFRISISGEKVFWH